eukprot:36880-Pelagomonas_calceolata.AAC.1
MLEHIEQAESMGLLAIACMLHVHIWMPRARACPNTKASLYAGEAGRQVGNGTSAFPEWDKHLGRYEHELARHMLACRGKQR